MVRITSFVLASLVLVLVSACGSGKSSSQGKQGVCPAAAKTNTNANAREPELSGVVVDTINTAGYTYANVKIDTSLVWAAAPQCKIKPGDTVSFVGAMPMKGYHSKTLNRTFDMVYFSAAITKKGERMGAACAMSAPAHSMMDSIKLNGQAPRTESELAMDFSAIHKPQGGYTVEDLFKSKDALCGKKVTLRAKVVKANYNIMNRNWLHLRDGTGANGADEVVATSSAEPKVGQTAVVSGILGKDKNIGAGYKFALIIEDASVTVEK